VKTQINKIMDITFSDYDIQLIAKRYNSIIYKMNNEEICTQLMYFINRAVRDKLKDLEDSSE